MEIRFAIAVPILPPTTIAIIAAIATSLFLFANNVVAMAITIPHTPKMLPRLVVAAEDRFLSDKIKSTEEHK
jgi:hypothetical protein